MKNYKKIYERLIKEIEKFRQNEYEYGTHKLTPDNIRDYLETQYALSIFKVLDEIYDEVSGKKWHNNIMRQSDFKAWKEKIK